MGVHFLSEAENAVEVAHDSAEQKAKEEKKAKKSKKGKKKSKKNVDEREAEAEEEEQPQNDAHPLLLEGVMGPIHSDPAFVKEIYFVGIIDPLSRYKLKKKVAHFLKEIIWDADTLSTVRSFSSLFSPPPARMCVCVCVCGVACACAVPS